MSSQKSLGDFFQLRKPRGAAAGGRKQSKLSQSSQAASREEQKSAQPANDGFLEAELDVRQATGREGASLGSVGAYGLEASDEDEVDPAEQMLRDFDLDYKFGPCLSTTRLERWERAERLGLHPPKAVKQLLHAGERNECLWAGRV
ncbi:hypothetical protein KFL_002560130 [Klebsormidium nitens]|uniref:DNA polymerase delta subunit 4 n=1 Tax=Klebsormidium nitens TaxID=105231 RepID=A0A0U9HVC3_KLENI|nr:hypothetical protein KFL_002560130 [Klebsormidium nitens]|eukprot:GAQ85829.1 hypothetical protein KFL_002560130 [Klebsormidium nitens]